MMPPMKISYPHNAEVYGIQNPKEKDMSILFLFTCIFSFSFCIAAPIAAIVTREGWLIFENLHIICTSPSKLITDYFNLGGVGSTFLNVGVCGLACNLIVLHTKSQNNPRTICGYFLVIAHGFYGLNFINMWPPFIGVLVYSKVMRKPIHDTIHIAMFATALAPFISDFLFRYPLDDAFVFMQTQISVLGIFLALIFGIATGFIIPALLPGTTAMHRGYNLYKAGLAIGLLGCFVYAFFYKTLGVQDYDALVRDNPLAVYEQNLPPMVITDILFSCIFLGAILTGFFLNGRSFRGYRALFRHSGHHAHFIKDFGAPLCLINIGIYGLCILAYLTLLYLCTGARGCAGPTAGVTLAAITFATAGQTPRNVSPIVFGYMLLYAVSALICAITPLELSWTLSSQGYINGLAFATGLCPFAGKYGMKIGILAGFINAIICTSTADMHGGFVLYNGGFAAGLTALILIPILDFYGAKEKEA